MPTPTAITASPNYIPVPVRRVSRGIVREVGGSYMQLRRFEAADTDRLNKERWSGAVAGQSINSDLLSKLETMRARAQYEIEENSTLKGIVKTYGDDVVGENGPGLQLISDGKDGEAYCAALEAVCADVFNDLDAAGQGALPEVMRLWIRGFWDSGEFLSQIVSDPEVETPVKLRLHAVASRRLVTPSGLIADNSVVMGVRRNKLGRPTHYAVSRVTLMGVVELYTGGHDEIPARDIIHGFEACEPGQARGIPWLASCLNSQAELRDYDAQVLDAARMAATWAVSLYTDHPDAEYIDIGGSSPIERGQYAACPPGWKPMALTPPQPATNYVDYRSERQRDAGRAVGMPLMTVRLDSSNHNYSSARFDAQVYRRGIGALRGWLRRRVLDRLVNLIAREAELYAVANPKWEHAAALKSRPAKVTIRWTWQAFPHVDDEKEANGQRMRMEDGTLTFSDACLENGQDPDAVIAQLKKDTAKLLEAGITPPWMRNEQSGSLPQLPSDELQAAAEAEGIDIATAMQAQKSGSRRGAQAATTAVALNGAQILAAVDVMAKVATGAIVPLAATNLLVAVGIPADQAAEMVKATPIATVKDPDKAFKQDVIKAVVTQIVAQIDVAQTLADAGLKASVAKPAEKAEPEAPPTEKPAAAPAAEE